MAKSKKTELQAIVSVGDNAAGRLLGFIQRCERLDTEKRSLTQDRKAVLDEAKGMGFDTKIINHLIKLRKMDKDDRDEMDTLVDTYERAIDEAEKTAGNMTGGSEL